MKKFLPIIIIALIVVGASAFYAGNKYGAVQKNNRSMISGNKGGIFLGNGERRGAGAPDKGSLVRGQVISKNTSTITIKLDNGGSKVVLYSTSTLVRQTVQTTVDQIQPGENVTVTGAANSDGSVTANSIQMVPANQASSTFGF